MRERYRLLRARIARTKYETALERFRCYNEAPEIAACTNPIFQVRRMSDRRPQLAQVNFARPFTQVRPRPDWVTVFCCNQAAWRCERSR